MLVLLDQDPVLIDREALALVTRRSPHTIRARCQPVSRTDNGRPLYDLYASIEDLADIPTRNRQGKLPG